ncbi:MAG: hypothetical protein LBB45_00950 [Methanobrevibacter sp.]|jgi:hypothetical protein|nr:hypothetical protein [Candidatus Methanovirga basalitermitum]
MITDGMNFYPDIINGLGVPRQICSFHKIQNLMDLKYKNSEQKPAKNQKKKKRRKNFKTK